MELEKTIHIILDPGPRRVPPEQNGSLLQNCACLTVNDVGKPCEGESHTRIDGGVGNGATTTAPASYSTHKSPANNPVAPRRYSPLRCLRPLIVQAISGLPIG